MIKTKQDYIEYLKADEYALGLEGKKYWEKFRNPIYRFQKRLRFAEYINNVYSGKLWAPLRHFSNYRYSSVGLKLGFSIPLNVFGKGLAIAHYGTIIVNSHASIGDYCLINADVNIGSSKGGSDFSPRIGKRVYIGPGAKLFGPIYIADDCAIGANSVVNKSFETPGVSIGGIPSKIISNRGSTGRIRYK